MQDATITQDAAEPQSPLNATGLRARWRWRPSPNGPAPAGEEAARDLAGEIGTHPLIARLLFNRGLDRPDVARPFLHPRLADLTDPADLPGASEAACRIAQAVRDGRRIVIYGDYDVDGVTASATLWHTLRLAGASPELYIPHRVDEGYGLHVDAIDQFAGDGDRPLIVSVDCGITAHEPAERAAELGAELIITDHHQFDRDHLPPAAAIVHPRLTPAGEAAPTAELCGAGVALKLAWQSARELVGSDRLPEAYRELLVDLLALVALGTVADVVPLRDENRLLTIFGLGRIKQTRFVGLNAMIDAARLRDEKIDAYHVGFVLGPRLNACGRMGHARDAARLLTDASPDEAKELAMFLTQENERRRATEREIVQQADELIASHNYHTSDQRAIVLSGEQWHPGVVGIVASRLVERYTRPVVVLNENNGIAKGSARSVEGVSIHDAFQACAEHLDKFGGHEMAGGVTLATRRIDSFRQALVEYVNERLKPADLVPLLDVDVELELADCTLELFERIAALAPFGRGNPRPRLLLRELTLEAPARVMGRGGQHLSLMVRQDETVARAVAFNMGEYAQNLPAGCRLDLVIEPHVSTWQGRKRVELHVQDLAVR